MLNREQITDKLKQIMIASDARAAQVVKTCTEDSRLTTDLGLSSVGMLYLVIAIEESFDIQFDDVGMNDFNTLRDVIDYVQKKLA